MSLVEKGFRRLLGLLLLWYIKIVVLIGVVVVGLVVVFVLGYVLGY